MNNTIKVIKLVLAGLLFLCLLKMPYGYYQFIRLVSLVVFSVLAIKAVDNKNTLGVVFYAGLAILFQPLIKIPLGRELWNLIDVIVGIILIGTIFIKKKVKE